MLCNDKTLWALHQGSQKLLDPDHSEDVNLNTLLFLKYYWQHRKCSGLWNLSGAGILSSDLLYLFCCKEPEVLGNQDTEVELIFTKFLRGKGLSSPPEFSIGRIWLCNQWPLMLFLSIWWRRRYRYLYRRNFPGAGYEQPIRQCECQNCSSGKKRCCKSEISRSTFVLGRWPHSPGCVLILCLCSSSICTDSSFSALNLSYLKLDARSLSRPKLTKLSSTLYLSIWSSLSNCFLIWFCRLYPQSSMGLQVRSNSLLCIWRLTSCLPQGQNSDPIFYSTGTKHTSLYKISRRLAYTILKWKGTAVLWHLC